METMISVLIMVQTIMIGINTVVLLVIGGKTLKVVLQNETKKIY